MSEISKKSLTIINRHYPPNPGITGESAWDLAKYLIEKHDIEVNVVCINGSDDGGGQIRHPVGVIYSLSSIYEGSSKLLKQVSGFLDGYFLIKKAKKINASAPIICMTSPPLLPFWASLFLKQKKWAFWSMDLFPEAFVSIGMISENNFLYRWILKKTYQNPPQYLIALGRKQAEFISQKFTVNSRQREAFRSTDKLKQTILPCGVIFHQTYETEVPAWRKSDDGKIYFGYCGNLNDAHNEDFLIEFIKAFNPAKHHLILALYGKKASKVLEFAQSREGITVLTNVPRSQLNFIDVHLVSLLSKYTHLMIPSKAVSAIASGGAMLFCGSQESDNWDMLQEASWLINEQENLSIQIKKYLINLTHDALAEKKQAAKRLNTELQKTVLNAYEEIADFVKRIS
jgi:hypothetical protein